MQSTWISNDHNSWLFLKLNSLFAFSPFSIIYEHLAGLHPKQLPANALAWKAAS